MRNAQEALAPADVLPSLVAEVLEALPVAVVVVDAGGRIAQMNREAERMLGHRRRDLLGRHINVLLPDRICAQHEDWRRAYMSAPEPRQMGANRDLSCLRADGSLLPVEIGLKPIHTDSGDFVVAAILDISARKELERRTQADKAELERLVQERTAGLERARAELERLSREDALTGLANRREFDARLAIESERSVRHEHPLAIAMLDLDHFKAVNDHHGHAVGDEVLRQVGHILEHHSRAADLAARYGGEEFVLALPDTSLAEARSLCERMRQAIAGFDWATVAPGLSVTISIGVAMRNAEESGTETVAAADRCLYEAKHHGRNQVWARTVDSNAIPARAAE